MIFMTVSKMTDANGRHQSVALGVSHVMRSINVRYLLTYTLHMDPSPH